MNQAIQDSGRRDFLKELGMLAGGTALLSMAPWLKSCSPSGDRSATAGEQARIALIGCGSRGQYHLTLLKDIPSARVVAFQTSTKSTII